MNKHTTCSCVSPFFNLFFLQFENRTLVSYSSILSRCSSWRCWCWHGLCHWLWRACCCNGSLGWHRCWRWCRCHPHRLWWWCRGCCHPHRLLLWWWWWRWLTTLRRLCTRMLGVCTSLYNKINQGWTTCTAFSLFRIENYNMGTLLVLQKIGLILLQTKNKQTKTNTIA